MNGAPPFGNLNPNSHSDLEKMEWTTLIDNGNINDASKRDSNEQALGTVETAKVLTLLQCELKS